MNNLKNGFIQTVKTAFSKKLFTQLLKLFVKQQNSGIFFDFTNENISDNV